MADDVDEMNAAYIHASYSIQAKQKHKPAGKPAPKRDNVTHDDKRRPG